MTVVAATNNEKKLVELRALLSGAGMAVKSLREVGFYEEIEETGVTFEENALIKAETVCAAVGLPAVADDSGLEVDVLGGAPGVYSARYGGEICQNDVDRYQYLLENMAEAEDRRARFVSVIACVWPDGETLTAEGVCAGEILREPRGGGGFGYDPVFYLPEEGLTMAEISPERKNAISHRAAAMAAFLQKLKERNT